MNLFGLPTSLPCLLGAFLIFNICMASAGEVEMVTKGGVHHIPVTINQRLTLDFIVDTGAAEITIPADVILTLIRTGTLTVDDALDSQTYILADGSRIKSERFRLDSIDVGGILLEGVTAAVGSVDSRLLLGQNALSRLEPWRMDTRRGVMVFSETLEPHRTFNAPQVSDGVEEVRAFLLSYLEASNNGNVSRLISYYGDRVAYFAQGKVNRHFIEQDKRNYFRRWPRIRYQLEEDMDVILLNGGNTAQVTFLVDYWTSSNDGQRTAAGLAPIPFNGLAK